MERKDVLKLQKLCLENDNLLAFPLAADLLGVPYANLYKFFRSGRNEGLFLREKVGAMYYIKFAPSLPQTGPPLVQERQLKWHSVNVYFNALENFFDFLVYFRHVRINPIPFYRKRCMRIYKDEEPEQSYVPKLKEMAEFVDSIDDPAIKAAVVMGSKCTLRLTEMLNQQYSHVDLEKNSAIVYKHKKRSNTLVFFDRETEDVLKDLIDQRKPKEYLFVQENGRPYSHETFRRHL